MEIEGASSTRKLICHLDNSAVQVEDTPSKNSGRSPRLLLALPPAVKAAIERSAQLNSRTVTAEINERLKASLKMDADNIPALPKTAQADMPASADGYARVGPSDVERQLVTHFRNLAADKQLALLTLLRR